MNDELYRAVMIAEGEMSTQSEEEYLNAWQTLVDTGLAWRLQGRLGRTALDLLDAGLIHRPGEEPNTERAVRKQTYDRLQGLLGDNKYREIDNGFATPLTVEKLAGHPLISLAHYRRQTAAVIVEPEVVFLVQHGGARPVFIRKDGVDHATVEGYFPGTPVLPDLQKRLDRFSRRWLESLEQQGFMAKARELNARQSSPEELMARANEAIELGRRMSSGQREGDRPDTQPPEQDPDTGPDVDGGPEIEP